MKQKRDAEENIFEDENNLVKEDNPENQVDASELGKTGYELLMDILYERTMSARDVWRILRLRRYQLTVWEDKNVRFGREKPEFIRRGWRRFSINDIISFQILIKCKKIGIPLSKNQGLVKWIMSYNLLYSIVPAFSQGEKVAIYFSPKGVKRFYAPGFYEQLEQDLQKSKEVIFFIPMNDILKYILKKVHIDGFSVRMQDDNVDYVIENVCIPGKQVYKEFYGRDKATESKNITNTSDMKHTTDAKGGS